MPGDLASLPEPVTFSSAPCSLTDAVAVAEGAKLNLDAACLSAMRHTQGLMGRAIAGGAGDEMTAAEKVAVVGAGTTGTGIAEVFAAQGYSVSLCSRSSDTLDAARIHGRHKASGRSADDALRGGELGGDIYGGDGNDIIEGGGMTKKVDAGAGDDAVHLTTGGTAFGGDGNDYLLGSAANDLLKGENGNDTLIGGIGVDQLVGGAGADTFLFRPGDLVSNRFDGILDFHSGEDKIDLLAFGSNLIVSTTDSDPKLLMIDQPGSGMLHDGIRVYGDHSPRPTS